MQKRGSRRALRRGEFVRKEMHHIREGKHGARSPRQAIAIGLSKARRAGVNLEPPKKGNASDQVVSQAERDIKKGRTSGRTNPSRTRSKATSNALKREGRSAASPESLSRHARQCRGKAKQAISTPIRNDCRQNQRHRGFARSGAESSTHSCEAPFGIETVQLRYFVVSSILCCRRRSARRLLRLVRLGHQGFS